MPQRHTLSSNELAYPQAIEGVALVRVHFLAKSVSALAIMLVGHVHSSTSGFWSRGLERGRLVAHHYGSMNEHDEGLNAPL
jgi:hypothetical protein